MIDSKILLIIGMIFNILSSVSLLFPYLFRKSNVKDDFITFMNNKGDYIQKKHIKENIIRIVGFILSFIGIIFQIIVIRR